ncbi:uncharacterized protein [Procambarus clarkii]|uniref:uncharacterized protein isoform X3 n=1 Tax=Procambarus clarkii TaxID=6728 RepID=UPI003744A60D
MASGSAPQHLPPQHPGGPQLHPHNTGGPQLHPHNTGGQQLNPHHTRGHQLDPHHTRGHQLDPHHTRGHQLDPHHTRGHQLDPHHTRGHQLDSHHTRGHQLDPHLHSGIVGGCGSVGSSGAEGCGSVGSSGAEGCGSVASSGAGGCGSVGASGAGGCGRCGQALSIFFNKRVRCGGGCQLAACGKCAPWNTAAGAHVCAVCAAAAAHQVWPQEAPTPTVDHAASVEVKRLSEQAKWDLLLYYYCYCYGEQELPPPPPAAAAAGPAPPPAPAAAPAGDPVGPPAPVGPAPAPAAGTVPSPIGGACETWEVVRSSAGPGATPAPTPALHHAMILPCQMERYDPASTRHTPGYDPASTRHTPGYDPAISPETPVEDFNSHTYEDILATAILNKVLETCEEGRPDEVTIEVSHDVASTDTDSGMSGGVKESRRGRHKRGEVSEGGSEGSEERSLTPLHHPAHRPPTVSPDQGVVTDDCWGNAVTGDGAPLQFKIEEHVEEITTHHLTDDDQDLEGIYDEEISDSGGSWRGSRCSLDDSRETRRHKVSHHSVTEDPLLSTINAVLPDPAQISSRRASFPELGADIIQDSCLDVECCEVGPCDMVLDSDTWEENWLFRRQRLTGASVVDPVTMLIPNPEAHVPATVGNRDVDELSELSDQQSIGSGEPWSLSESDGEVDGGDSYQPSTASRELSTLAGEIVAEFAQQDQEYTVDYSVPSRVTAAATGAHSNKHLASPYSLPTSSQKSPEAQHLTRFLYANQEEVLRNYHDGKAVQGIRNPGITEKSHIDSDFVFEGERPVPKPRKLSLATTHASKIPAKSPVQLLLSSVEDLTILSPPLEIPHPKNASSKSESVWFVETPEDSVIMQGRTLRLSCQVNAKKPMGVSWYHNGSLVPVGGCDQWAYRRGPSHHLHVYDMKAAAAGVYAAAAYTATNCVWAFCRVQHKANSRPPKRPTFTKGLVDMTVEEGGEVNVQCQVQGHPEPRVIFSRDSRTLEPSSRLAIQSDQYGTWMLRLIECTASDSGEITATAVNAMSTVITQCRIRVVPEGTPISHQDHTDSGRLHSSLQTDKQQDPRPGGRHICKKHNPGSHSPNSLPSSSDNLLTSAKTPAASHQGNLTKSSGVNTDAGDVDDVQQVPTRPGTIAEREHRKWEAAVSLPNNPYAPERLVQRLSHAHAPERNPPLRRALSVEFPEEGGKELDPSLRDGVPPKPDLNRYSRDYYVTTTSGKTSSLNFRHQKCQQQAQQQQDNQLQKGRQQKLYKSEIMLSANGHQARTPTSLDHSTYVEDPIHIIDGGLQKANKSSSEATLHQLRSLEVESSHPSDWKNELRDIQAARVEREVARFQRTIDETQRRWEENYARHIPRSVHANAQSDSSTEVLHNPRVDVYLVPRRHDLWRTVSEDTIAAQPRERPFLQPFLRHTSADNLQPMAKVSNLHNLESAPQHSSRSMNSMSSMSNVNINSLTGLGKRGNYLHHSKFGRSVESVSTYSDGESHGEGMESDVSTRTLDDVPALPSVRKLASKFDLASQERVNDLDKRGRDKSLSSYGNKNILAEKWSPGDQVHRRNLTNNLNKQTEKPYVVKEVRSLPSGEDSHPATETDMFNSDVDSTEFDDEATVTSVSLPPTPGSLSDKRSLSTPSLIDTDSCFSVDSRDSNMTASYNQFSDRTIFGVTLRRTSINSSDSYSSRKQTSLSSFSSAEELQGAGFEQVSHKSRHSWSTSKGHLETKVIQYDNDPDAPKMLRQSSVTKTHHGSMFDLSYKESDKLRHQKQFHSSLDLSSVSKSAEVKTRVELAQVNTRDAKNPTKIQGMNKQVGMPNVSILSGSAFAPKGKRTMSDFLNSYTGHKSLLDLKRIEEKTEDDTDGRRSRDARKQQRYSDHPKDSFNKKDTFKISKCEGSLQSTDRVAVGSMGQQDNNGDRVRHKQTNINIPSVNNLSPQPLLCTDLENAENIEQTSRNDQIAIPVSFSPVVVDDSETKKLSDDPSDKISHISDITDDDSSSHTSDGTNTGTLTNFTEDDQFMIELNEASVSAFQCQVTKDIPAPTESNDKLPSVSNSPIMLNKGSEKKPIISTTSVNSLQKHRSIGDLLREYTNISSLDEKSAFSKTTISSNVATESNKTIITISDNEMNLQTQAPKVVKSIASAHNAVVCPTTASAHNVAVSPTTVSVHNIAVSSTKANAHNVAGFPIKLSTDLNKGNMNVKSYNREEATGDLGDQIQTLKNKYPEENCPNTTNECTVITLSGEEAPLSDPAIAVYHASIVYVGDNVKESHIEDSALSSASGKTSSVSEDVNGSVSVLSTHTKLPPSEDNVDSITISHSRTEKKPVPQSPQSAYLGKSSVNVDTIISSSLAEVQDNDVHINIKKDDLSTTGSHVTIISVSKAADSFSPSQKSNVISSSAENSSDDEILFDDPVALTRLIVHNSRVGNSNKFKPRKKLDIRNASVPVNSPFSPIRSKSNIGKLEFERGITEDSQPNKLGLRDSYDEGVHSQLSDMEMTPSTTSTKSKSTSSLDIACEGHEPMVECN